MSFALIDAKKAEIPIETACAALGVSVSGFYAWKSRPASGRQTDDMMMLAHIRAEFSTSNETYGSRRAGGARGATHACRVERERLVDWATPRGPADERERPESTTENAFQEDHRQRSSCRRHVFDMMRPRCDERPRSGLHGNGAGSEMGCRHLVCLDDGRVAVSRDRPGLVLAQDRRLAIE